MKNMKPAIAMALLLLFTGCATTNTKPFMLIDKDAFLKRRTMNVNIPEGCDSVAITLLSIPQVVGLDFKDDDVKTVLYATLKEKKHLHIDKHMINGYDYLHDLEKEVIGANLEVPQVYMMKETATFMMTLAVLDRSGKVKKFRKSVSLNWKPKATMKKGETGLKYTTPFSDDIQNSEKKSIKANLKKELLKTNTRRLEPDYRNEITLYMGK